MSTTKRFALLLPLALLVSGCMSHVINDVKRRAAFELNCPEEQVVAAELSSDVYGGKGCGRTLSCRDIPFVGLMCEEINKPAPTASAL